MQRWGILVTTVYLLLLVLFLLPLTEYLLEGRSMFEGIRHVVDADAVAGGLWIFWVCAGVLVTVQALLLLVSVDTTRKRLRPRRHVMISVSAIAFAAGLLSGTAFTSLVTAILGDDALEGPWIWPMGLIPLCFWLAWGVVFYVYRQRLSERLDRAIHGLIAGSILQLLVAVPSHIIVRQRNDCSAPGVTAFGIATGIAVMLMAFGPAVVFLYQRRLRDYRQDEPAGISPRYVAAGVGAIVTALLVLFLLLPVHRAADQAGGFTVREGQTAEFMTAVARLAERFGLEHSYPNITCDNQLVATLRIPDKSPAQTTYHLYSAHVANRDAFAAFAGEFHKLVETYRDPAKPSTRSEAGLAFERFRARLLSGVYWGQGCRLTTSG